MSEEQPKVFPVPPVMIEADSDADQSSARHGVSSGNNNSNDDNNNNNHQYVMDMSRLEAPTEEEESGAPKRARKMTSTSDATSVTAASSFLDEGGTDDDGYAPGGGQYLVKPRLDSLDEIPRMDEDCDNGSDGNKSEKEEEEQVEPDSCCYVWFKRIFLFLVIFASISFLVVLVGAAVEKKAFDDKEGTSHLYQLPQVCGAHFEDLPFGRNATHQQQQQQQLDASSFTMLTTFDSAEEARDSGLNVAHCGSCGSCSTSHDLSIMAQTTDSLTRDSTRCAFKIFLGRKAVEKCMEERVGFTPACEDCWLDNIGCSFKSCKFTCIKYKLFRQDNNNGEDDLNDCLKCDERMCGEDFTVCSGSNRRRMGIISDIGRNADIEQCTDVDVDWASLNQGGSVLPPAEAEDGLFD